MTNQKGRVTKWCRRVAETALRVAAAPARRLFALAIVWGLGGLLVALVLSRPFPVGWATMLIGFGGAVLALAEAMRRATARVLLLDGQGLREEGGRKIVAWSELAGIERGVLAFKPSGGLTLVLHAPAPRAWDAASGSEASCSGTRCARWAMPCLPKWHCVRTGRGRARQGLPKGAAHASVQQVDVVWSPLFCEFQHSCEAKRGRVTTRSLKVNG